MNTVLLLVPAVGEAGYGGGHRARMKIIRKLLESRGLQALLLTPSELTKEHIASAGVVFLDRRDDGFPGLLLEAAVGQGKGVPLGDSHPCLVAVDNRGPGREQAGLVWDTLPYPQMSPEELKLSLSRMILPQGISSLEPAAMQSRLHRVESFAPGREELEALYPGALVQTPNPADRTDESDFLEKLKQAATVVTYFGQTLFEAIYLGKEIYLYDITDYHRSLADFFYENCKNAPTLLNHLDGRGAERLVEMVGLL